MSQELHYTSAPRGLFPGSHGYSTVGCTAQMPRALVGRLEGLSVYRNIYPPHDPRAPFNPVAFSHLRVMVGGMVYHVLSRTGFAGLDYTDRTNKYAHHVALEPSELPLGGPAWLLSRPDFLRASWDGRVGYLPDGREVPEGDSRPGVCEAWRASTGDAGWAGVLAESFLAGAKPPAFLVFDPGTDLLPLIAEAQALLPPERRWDLTFSTYFTGLPQGVACAWRGVVRGSPEEANARRMARALVLDLGQPPGLAKGGALVEQARTGRRPSAATEAPPAIAGSPSRPPRFLAADGPDTVPFGDGEGPSPRFAVAGGPPPLSPGRQGRPNRRRRRVVLAAGAACLAILLGGLIAWRFLLKTREATRPDKTPLALNKAPAPKKERRSAREEATDPSRKGPSPTGERLRATPGPTSAATEKRVEAAPAVNTKPAQASVHPPGPAPERAGPTADRGRMVEPQPDKTRAKPIPDGAPGTQDVPVTKAIPVVYRYLTEPFPRPGLTESDDHHLTQSLPSDNCKLRLLGLDDPEYKHLKLGSEHPEGDEGRLRVYAGASPSKKYLGTFQVEEDGVHFRWDEGVVPGFRDHAFAIQSCILLVDPTEKTPRSNEVYRIVLRKFVEDLGGLDLKKGDSSRSIKWGEQGPPHGRRLIISRHQINGKGNLLNPKETTGRSLSFSIPKYDRLTLDVRLDPPAKSKGSTANDTVRLVFNPSRVMTKAGILQQLDRLYNAISQHLERDGDRNDETDNALHRLRQNLNKIYKSLKNNNFDVSDELRLMEEISHDVEPLERKGGDEKTAKGTMIADVRSSISRIVEDLKTLDQFHAFQIDRDFDDVRLDLGLAIVVAGEPVDVARLGSLDEEGPGTAPAGGRGR